MPKSKRNSPLMTPLLLVALLAISMVCTIAYSYFHAVYRADTTIAFHGGVTLTIQAKDYPTSNSSGIQLSGTNQGEWLRKVDNETAWGNSTHAKSQLTMSGLRVSPKDSEGGVYVRLMVSIAVQYTAETPPTIPSIPFPATATSVTINQDNCTTKEWDMISTLNATNTTYLTGISIVALPTTQDTFTTILDDYAILVPDANNPTNQWQGATISAMIMITASTVNDMDSWNQAGKDASYTFTLN